MYLGCGLKRMRASCAERWSQLRLPRRSTRPHTRSITRCMRQVQLGGSELRVSQLGLGTMTFGERLT